MSIARRKILGLFAAAAATALPGCGGGDSGGRPGVPTRFLWVLNLNPEFTAADVSLSSTLLVSRLPFPALSPRIEAEFGTYTVGLRDRNTGLSFDFPNFIVDDISPSVSVFYPRFGSARLGTVIPGIANYFDSNVSLVAELDDGAGNVQTNVLAFESSAAQASRSANCRLRLRRATDGVLVYDSGLQLRTSAILIFPADTQTGLVAVVGVNYSFTDATAVSWPNIL
jgi:hypothetical protein